MLNKAAKRMFIITLVLAIMLLSIVSYAAPKQESIPSTAPEQNDDQKSADDDAAYNIKVPEIALQLSGSLLSSIIGCEYGCGIRFDINAALDSADFSADTLEGLIIGVDPGHQAEEDTELESIAPDSAATKIRQSAGATGIITGAKEHSINLIIANKLADILQQAGATVIMSRSEADVSISNAERAAIMNDAGVDFWIRLHCENSIDETVSGCTILIPADVAPSTDVAQGKAAEKASQETKPEQGGIYQSSLLLAQAVANEFCAVTGAKQLGIVCLEDQTGFNYSNSPVIAIEMGCLSNAADDIRLNRASYQNACAFGLYRGISVYYSSLTAEVDAQKGDIENSSDK